VGETTGGEGVGARLCFEDVSVGDELPAWSRETGLVNWNRFAAVNDEFYDVHMDDSAARAAENPQGAFGMGMMRFSYLHNLLRSWAGEDADIRELGCRYRAVNQKGDVLRVTGRVTGMRIEGDDHLVDIALDVINQDGESTTPGHAIVALASRPTRRRPVT